MEIIFLSLLVGRVQARLNACHAASVGVQTEAGFAGNRLHGAALRRRKLGGRRLECAEGEALSRALALRAELRPTRPLSFSVGTTVAGP